MFETGAIVILHLVNPNEKFWGVLEQLDSTGVVLRGINISSFDDWVQQVAKEDSPSLGLAAMFLPLFRVERIFLDEKVGAVEGFSDRFESRTGLTVETYLGLEGESMEVRHPACPPRGGES
ncbi:MAG: hypothetical protein OES47_07505 [Acidobacteriota bacterium]|nr:hypothetical protein [Acidobacteriota bacterium]